jgi:hypothetical protein
MTEDQIRKEYQDSGQLQDKFGSFDSYMGYINDSQDFVQSAEWMMANPEYKTGSKEWAFLNGEDLAWKPGQREQIQQKIIQDRVAARTSAFEQWMGGEAGSALMEKYGIEPLIQNDDGDKFKWTGSGYQKTYKVDDHLGPIDYGKMLIASGLAAGATPALASALGGIGGAALPAGVAGPSAPLIGGKLATGLAAGATNAASQGLLTGSIDPKSVLTSAVMAGINPGGYVADKYTPWRKTDAFTGDKSWAFGGAPPSSFMGGLVSGTVNDLVSNGITNGEIDLQGSLEKGLISGGINSALNTWDEWKGNSQEAIADRIQYDNPVRYSDDAEYIIDPKSGAEYNINDLTLAQQAKLMADGGIVQTGRDLAMSLALESSLLNTTDFGALIGDDGLFSFIPRADLTSLRNITDPAGDLIDGLLNGFDRQDYVILSDGTKVPKEKYTSQMLATAMMNGSASGVEGLEENSTLGLLNNPVVDGIANVLGGALDSILPSGDGSLSEDLQAQKDQFGQEWDSLYGHKYPVIDKNGLPTGQLSVAGQAAKNDYIQTKMDTLGSFFFENSGGLNENYSWSPNPRGDSEIWGTMVGLPGQYSTGGIPYSVTSPPLKPDGTPVTPLNFGPEFTAPDSVQSDYSTSTVLPSNNDAALRNYGLISLFQDLTGDDDKNASSNSNAGSNTTDLNAGETAVSKDETLAGADPNAGETTVSTDKTLDGTETNVNENAVITDKTLAGSEEAVDPTDVLTSGDGGGGGGLGIPTGGRGGALTDWTDLYGYTKISPYKKARLKVLAGMLSGIPGVSMGSLALNFGSEKDPYQKIGRAVWDFGQERNA